MKINRIALPLCTALAAMTLAGCSTGNLSVKEVGSYHVGGRQVTLSGLPIKEVVFSPGAPPLKVNPNGDFEVEQMYVHYTKLADPKGKYPLLFRECLGSLGLADRCRLA